MYKKILVTGGAGFIGSNFLHYMVKRYPKTKFVNLDLLTYAGNLENLVDLEKQENYQFIKGSINNRMLVKMLVHDGVDAIVNFAAESHVDRSIKDPELFIKTNVMGTEVLLEAARLYGVKKFVQISTDEVYGSLEMDGYFTENSPLAPNSPYAASKLGADLLVRVYHKTYGLPVNITRCSNNYGPYQFPEKLIPFFITNALEDQELPIYGDGQNIRDWLYVEDHCQAIDLVLRKGKSGEVYNIGDHNEKTNLEMTEIILQMMKKPMTLIKFIEDRPGHDRRYAIDASKIKKELGWKPRYNFLEGIEKTIQWYVDHEDWWKRIKSGAYLEYSKNH